MTPLAQFADTRACCYAPLAAYRSALPRSVATELCRKCRREMNRRPGLLRHNYARHLRK